MTFKDRLRVFGSYFFPVQLSTYKSEFSGELFVYLINGRKVLDTRTVNYSFNSLHKVFKKAFLKSGINPDQIGRVLVLGLGGGSIVSILRDQYQVKAPIVAIDIDPVIIKIAESEFGIRQYEPLQLIVDDANSWMMLNSETYDIICVDLFINAEVPSSFLNISFIDELIRSANANGTIYFNIMVVSSQIESAFNRISDYLAASGLISSCSYIEVEENNRVLIIKK